MSASMIIAVSLCIAVAAILLAIVTPISEVKDAKRREEERTPAEKAQGKSSSSDKPKGFFDAYIKPTIRTFIPQSQLDATLSGSERGKLKELLERSGNPWDINENELRSFQILSAVLGLLIGIIVWFLQMLPIPVWAILPLFLALGFEAPTSTLKADAKARLREYDQALPELMDLLVINMKAGRNLESAMAQTVDKMPPSPLKAEMSAAMKAVRAGAPLRKTLQDLAKRSGSEDFQAFVKSITLSQDSGGDPSEAISHQAEIMRDQRLFRINKQVSKLSTYLTLVIMATMIPALLLIAAGPGMVQLIEFL